MAGGQSHLAGAAPRHTLRTRIHREIPALRVDFNRLFTANGKKSLCGLRTEPVSTCR
jgi:hypothetical protein